MKRILFILLTFMLCCLLCSSLADEATGDTGAAWSAVVSAFHDDEFSYPEGITVTCEEKNHYIISGEGAQTVLKDVVIDSRDDSTSFGAGSYTFRNLTLGGEFSIISEGNNAYVLTLEQSVHAEDAAIELYAGKWISGGKGKPGTQLHHGRIQATVYCKTDSIEASADYNSQLELVNHGSIGEIDARPYHNSRIMLENYGSIAVKNPENTVPSPDGFGTLFMEVDSNSSMDVINNSPHTQVLYAWVYDHSRLTIVNNGNSDRVDFNCEYNSNLLFTNNGTITNRRVDDGNEWGDDAVGFKTDETSKLTLDGSGRILPGHQHNSYYAGEGHLLDVDECSNDPDHPDGIPGPSIVLNTRYNFPDDVTYAQVVDTVHRIAKNITLDWDQIVTDESIPFPVIAVRRGMDGEDSETPVRTAICPILPSDTHPTPVHKKSDLKADADYGSKPLLFTESGVASNEDLFLRIDGGKPRGNTIAYDLTMIDVYNTKQTFEGTALVFIPYPDGMTRAQADGHEFELTHTTATGKEVFSTREGTLIRTESGLYAEVSSLSPFALSWTSSPAALPQTGDSSHLMLLCAAFLLSSTALYLERKTYAA